MEQFDLVVAGGGVVGCSLALALSQRTNLKIAVIEKQSMAAGGIQSSSAVQSSVSDSRVVALAEQSWQFLTSLGIADSLKRIATPINHIHVSDRGHLGHCELSAQEYGVEALGFVCGLSPLTQLLEQALHQSSVEWYRPDTIQSVKQKKDSIVVETEHSLLNAKLLVVAEGGESNTRKKLGFRPQKTSYDQAALVTNIRANVTHKNCAYERFTEHGPLALLPLGEKDYSVVWSLAKNDVDGVLNAKEGGFLHQLQQAFGYRAGIFEQCSQRQSFPLNLITVDNTVGHRCALVGNAVHTIHPIAGQGLNLGIRDVNELVKRLANGVSQDIGNFNLLDAYQRARLPDQKKIINMTDGLVRSFSNQHAPMVIGRNVGLVAMQFLNQLKQPLAYQAMGHMNEK